MPRSLATPAFWAAGWTCVGLGMLGVALPLLPTTPFLLLAAWCFDRSSPRLHAWLLRTRVLGPLLRDWRERGAIALRAKIACTLLLVAAAVVAFARGTTPGWALGGMLVVSIGALAFVWTRPSR